MIFNKKTTVPGFACPGFLSRHLPKLLIMCVVLPLSVSQVAAQTLPATACDPEYMDALESRAWLEAQREITQNQNLISKPDSVLEYTCFNRFLNTMSKNWGDRMFSETNHWGAVIGVDKTSTDSTLDNVVRTTMLAYLTKNFQHNFLGGRLPGIDYHLDDTQGSNPQGTNPTGTPNFSTTESSPRGAEQIVNGGSTPGSLPEDQQKYDCDRMAKVWELARCLNFMQRPDKESFFDFPWYKDHDPRDLPPGFAACQAPTLAATGGGQQNGQGTDAYSQAMRSAFNGDDNDVKLYTLQPDNDPFADDTRYKKDPVVSHLDLISPIGSNNVNQCSGSIKTGITVIRNNAQYDEIICTNPGCAQPEGGGNCTPR
jgi:hypothetical protein